MKKIALVAAAFAVLSLGAVLPASAQDADDCHGIPWASGVVRGPDGVGGCQDVRVTSHGLNISGSVDATNPSVGTSAAAVPTSATLIGSNVSGNLQPASTTNPIPVADGALLSALATETPAGDEEIGKTTPTISNLISGTITSAMTGTTSTSLIAAPGASLRNYITNFTCSNADADTDTVIALQDGSGGTTFFSAPAAKLMGGFTISFPTPLPQPTLNTALYVVNETTGATTKCSASGFKR